MGSLYDFACANCGYEAMVSGKDDRGMMCATTTILCEDCREICDAVVSETPWDKASYQEPVCPNKKSHRIRRWKHPDVCPRCGSEMERGEITTHWD